MSKHAPPYDELVSLLEHKYMQKVVQKPSGLDEVGKAIGGFFSERADAFVISPNKQT